MGESFSQFIRVLAKPRMTSTTSGFWNREREDNQSLGRQWTKNQSRLHRSMDCPSSLVQEESRLHFFLHSVNCRRRWMRQQHEPNPLAATHFISYSRTYMCTPIIKTSYITRALSLWNSLPSPFTFPSVLISAFCIRYIFSLPSSALTSLQRRPFSTSRYPGTAQIHN